MKTILTCLIVLFARTLGAQDANSQMPHWAEIMYNNGDPQLVFEAYQAYYTNHPFVKNRYTQDFKRWQRTFSRPEYTNEQVRAAQAYISKSTTNAKAFDSEWTCIGPYNFDIDAASRSYAPGAAHVYTIESCLGTVCCL